MEFIKRNIHGYKIMASGTTIVGNLKVMAHMIPNIIAPID